MSAAIREHEQEYLAKSSQLESLLQKKTAVYAVEAEMRELHRRLVDLGRAILAPEANPAGEQDYLKASAALQDLLRQREAAWSLTPEIEKLHGDLVALGDKLGWTK